MRTPGNDNTKETFNSGGTVNDTFAHRHTFMWLRWEFYSTSVVEIMRYEETSFYIFARVWSQRCPENTSWITGMRMLNKG